MGIYVNVLKILWIINLSWDKSIYLLVCWQLNSGLKLNIFRYGEIVDVNLVRDKGTGKPRGFAFVAYEDQRSTILAVGCLPSPAGSFKDVRTYC